MEGDMENVDRPESSKSQNNEDWNLFKQYVDIMTVTPYTGQMYLSEMDTLSVERMLKTPLPLTSGDTAKCIVQEYCVWQRVVEVSTIGEGSRIFINLSRFLSCQDKTHEWNKFHQFLRGTVNDCKQRICY